MGGGVVVMAKYVRWGGGGGGEVERVTQIIATKGTRILNKGTQIGNKGTPNRRQTMGYFSLNDFHAWAACNGQNSK